MAKNVDPFDTIPDDKPKIAIENCDELLRRRLRESFTKEENDVTARAKPLEELVVYATFTVDEVVGETYQTSVISEMRMGGRSLSHDTGYTSRLVLKVTPDDPKIPVHSLTFDGISSVRVGDYISAKIPRYEEKVVYGTPQNMFDKGERSLYVDRAFKPEEVAIELSILNSGKVLRTDRAVDYSRFVKK
jgi:hypothetical protein